MQEIHTPNSGEGASVSRRKFMAFAAAGSVSVPSLAAADASQKTDRLPQSLESQFNRCVEQLKHILQQMHPAVDDVRHQYFPMNGGRSYIFGLAGHAPPLCEWSGPGEYEVAEGEAVSSGVYFIDRRWSEMDKRWFLHGAYVWEGQHIAPRQIIDPRLIIRKVGGLSI